MLHKRWLRFGVLGTLLVMPVACGGATEPPLVPLDAEDTQGSLSAVPASSGTAVISPAPPNDTAPEASWSPVGLPSGESIWGPVEMGTNTIRFEPHAGWLKDKLVWLDLRTAKGRGLLSQADGPLSLRLAAASLNDQTLLDQLADYAAKHACAITIEGEPVSAAAVRALTTIPIHVLELNNTQLDDDKLGIVANVKSLRMLNIALNPAAGNSGLKHLGALSNLRHLIVYGSAVDDEGLVHLRPHHNLTHLSLGRTVIGDEGLAKLSHLKNLESLDLEATKVTDKGLPALHSLTHFQSLNLAETSVTESGVTALRAVFDEMDREVPPLEINW